MLTLAAIVVELNEQLEEDEMRKSWREMEGNGWPSPPQRMWVLWKTSAKTD